MHKPEAKELSMIRLFLRVLVGIVASIIAKRNMLCVAIVVGVMCTIVVTMNMRTIPAQSWMWIEVTLYILVARVAARLVMKWRRTGLANCSCN